MCLKHTKCFMVLSVALLFVGCSDKQNTNVKTDKAGIPIPVSITAADLPSDSGLKAEIYIDLNGSPLDSKSISAGQTEVNFNLSLLPGNYQFTIKFVFDSEPLGPVSFASAESGVIEVNAGETKPLEFHNSEYFFPDNGGDHLTNLRLVLNW